MHSAHFFSQWENREENKENYTADQQTDFYKFHPAVLANIITDSQNAELTLTTPQSESIIFVV